MKRYIIHYSTDWTKGKKRYYTTVNAESAAKARTGFDLSIAELLRLRVMDWCEWARENNAEELANPAKGLKIYAKLYKPAIGEIASKATRAGSHYFDRQTLNFFGQTLGSFSVHATDDPDIWETRANGKHGLVSVAQWDLRTGKQVE